MTIVLLLGFIIINIILTNIKPRRAPSAISANLAKVKSLNKDLLIKMSQVVQLNDDHNSQCFV